MEIAIVLGLLLIAIIAFSTEKISVDIVTMCCVCVLVFTGILEYKQAFAPFGSDFIIMLASIFIISAAIDKSGVLEVITAKIIKKSGGSQSKLIMPLITITSALSAFMNNTTVTALMINPAIAMAKKSKISNSKILLPVAFASIVGGTCTLIGTSTNVAVNAYLDKNGYPTLGMWDFSILGIIMVVITLVYMYVIGIKMLPDRGTGDLTQNYGVKQYLSEIVITKNSKLINQVVHESDLAKMGINTLAIIRDGRQFAPGVNISFEADDLVLVKGEMKNLIEVKDTKGIEIMADTLDFYDGNNNTKGLKMKEMIVPGRSNLAGKTIAEVNFRRRLGMVVVAIYREGESFIDKLNNIKLEVGDMLLVQGKEESFGDLHSHHDIVVLSEYEHTPKNLTKGYLALGFFIVAVIVGSLDFLKIHVSIAFLAAAVLCMLFDAIKPDEAYRNIEWKLLVLIAGMTSFGTAMANTGADKFLANLIVDWCSGLGPNGIMAGFMILTVLLTQPMSNAAAALVVLPVALGAATALHVNPMTYAVAVMLSASVSLITPFEPSCIIVYSPGRYKFIDFVKVGGLLTIILMIVIYFGVPMIWPM